MRYPPPAENDEDGTASGASSSSSSRRRRSSSSGDKNARAPSRPLLGAATQVITPATLGVLLGVPPSGVLLGSEGLSDGFKIDSFAEEVGEGNEEGNEGKERGGEGGGRTHTHTQTCTRTVQRERIWTSMPNGVAVIDPGDVSRGGSAPPRVLCQVVFGVNSSNIAFGHGGDVYVTGADGLWRIQRRLS